jgi:hypothetical protein
MSHLNRDKSGLATRRPGTFDFVKSDEQILLISRFDIEKNRVSRHVGRLGWSVLVIPQPSYKNSSKIGH